MSKLVVGFISAGILFSLMPQATAASGQAENSILTAKTEDVKALLSTSGSHAVNDELLQRMNSDDAAAKSRFLHSAKTYKLQKLIAALPFTSGAKLGDEVSKITRTSASQDQISDSIARYISAVRLADGKKLIDIVAPELLFGRYKESSKFTPSSEVKFTPSSSISANSCTDWSYYGVRSHDVNYALTGWIVEGKTQFKRTCQQFPKVEPALADHIEVGVAGRKYDFKYDMPCNLQVLSLTKKVEKQNASEATVKITTSNMTLNGWSGWHEIKDSHLNRGSEWLHCSLSDS